jgi:hypothetical protein
MLGWDKLRQRSLFQPYILVMQVITLLALQVAAPRAGATGLDLAALAFVPVSLVGTLCGLAIFARLNDRQFAKAMQAMLLVSGLGLAL